MSEARARARAQSSPLPSSPLSPRPRREIPRMCRNAARIAIGTCDERIRNPRDGSGTGVKIANPSRSRQDESRSAKGHFHPPCAGAREGRCSSSIRSGFLSALRLGNGAVKGTGHLCPPLPPPPPRSLPLARGLIRDARPAG